MRKQNLAYNGGVLARAYENQGISEGQLSWPIRQDNTVGTPSFLFIWIKKIAGKTGGRHFF